MALPNFKEARLFYQAAKQRYQDGQFLLEGERTTASVYLAGYAVECMVKALLLSTLSTSKARFDMVKSFRGAQAHDYVWLKGQYIKNGGPSFPKEVARYFSLVNTWSTDMRYKPGTIKKREAVAFLQAAAHILEWADGRL